jgi:hypothetical protein
MAKRRLMETVKRAMSKAGAPVVSATRLVEHAVRTVDALGTQLTRRVRASGPAAAPAAPARERGTPGREAVVASTPAEQAWQEPARPVRVDAPGRAPRATSVVRATPDGRRAERGRNGTAAARKAAQTAGTDEPARRTTGRKTVEKAGTTPPAPRRASARKPAFKAKRGQKHRH